MSFNFLPSLQHMAAARIASRLILDPEIVRMIEEEEKLPFFGKIFDSDRQDYWKLIEKEAEKILPRFIPPRVGKIVAKFIRPMNYEFGEWRKNHFLYEDVNKNVLKSCLSWKTDGTIDRNETAKELVRHENIDLQSRFEMACTYFLEYESLVLWHQIIESKKGIFLGGSNSAVRFWLRMLKQGTGQYWKQLVNAYFGGSDIMWFDSRIRLSCFFDLLSLNNQKFYFRYHTSNMLHFDDFHLCLYKMDERERTKVLSANPTTALNHCLKWPFQSLFMEMAMLLCNKMDIHHFEVVFRLILDNCIIKGLEDFDYRELLEEFWHLTPAALKEELKKNVQLMKQITIVLNYDKTNKSISLEQTLNKYMRKNLPV